MARVFEYKQWIDAARQRRHLTKQSPQYVLDRFSEDRLYVYKMSRVIEWCTRRGLSVEFIAASGGGYVHDKKIIEVSYRSYPETQLYTLLHEIGHHLVESCTTERYRDKYAKGYLLVFEGERSPQHKIDAIAEELEAWYRGWKLAKRLHVYIDKKKYNA
jgi:hypothetical protein